MSEAENSPIGHVTDTATWVAVYRAEESKRPDALFRDPFAEKLVGARGFELERRMSSRKYVKWSLVMRTVIIDEFVKRAVREGVDTVVNLGCGLDARPYRMDLPADLLWIEVDFPKMIEYKTRILAEDQPKCRLERIAADLSDRKTRQSVLAGIARQTRKALVITEGVIIYLHEENVAELADELRSFLQFQFWVTEKFDPIMKRYLASGRRSQELRNAPIVFWPENWLEFFNSHGWEELDVQYLTELSRKLGRPMPMPWWAKLIFKVLPFNPRVRGSVSYVLWHPK